MRSIPVFALGLSCALAGIGMFAITLRKTPELPPGAKKAQQREQEIEQSNTVKLRIAGAVLVAAGSGIMFLSF